MSHLPIYLFALTLLCCGQVSRPAVGWQQPDLEFTSVDAATLARVKRNLDKQDPKLSPAYTALLRRADSLLSAPLYAVTDKTSLPPSGDKHDYLSLAPYWWPDPEQPDGLPWVRRDGERNPRTYGDDVDVAARRNAFGNIHTLGLAAYFSGDTTYASRTVRQLRTWFLDPATRMHPHLSYAQGVPGRSTGRCFGIIELRAITEVITSVELLDANGFLPRAVADGFDQWLTDYIDWLRESDLGREESATFNNHGTWYDVQLVTILRHLNRKDEARQLLERAKTKRLAAQLAADGSQPEELARTRALSYSTMNLEGLTMLAYQGRKLGVDLWGYRDAEGAGLPEAYAFLYPYATGEVAWPYSQLTDLNGARDNLRALFLRTGSQMNVPRFCQAEWLRRLPPDHSDRLLFPCLE